MYTEPKLVDPADTFFSCDGTPDIACHECRVLHRALHASILCQSDFRVGLRQFWTANVADVAVACAAVGVLLLTPILVYLLSFRLLFLTPVVVCGTVASGMQCLLNIPKILMVS